MQVSPSNEGASPNPNIKDMFEKQIQIEKSPSLDNESTKIQQERVTQLIEDNIRLKTRHLQLQDQLEELRRELLGEKSARQTLSVELNDTVERLQHAKDHLDQQKRDYSKISLQLCSVTAERNELEEKVTEVWNHMASIEETLHAKDATIKSLREMLENEKRERAAQEVLMNAMVAQVTTLEEKSIIGIETGERHRQVCEETLRSVQDEVQRVAHFIGSLTDNFMNNNSGLDPSREKLFLTQDSNMFPDIINNNNNNNNIDDGLNTSDTEGVGQDETRCKSTIRLLNPIYQSIKNLQYQLQRLREEKQATRHNTRILESHILALKEELHQLGSDGDNIREQLFRSEALRAQITETLESIRQSREHKLTQADEIRQKVALILHCPDDWCVIEQNISDLIHDVQQLQSSVEESRRIHDLYVKKKEEEVDSIMDSYQQELDAQHQELERVRHECERYKRAAAAATSTSTSTLLNTSGVNNSFIGNASAEVQREYESIRAKYRAVLQYVEDELEPLTVEQGKALQEEKRRSEELRRDNDALQLKLKLLVEDNNKDNNNNNNNNNRPSLFEALIVSLRVMSGAMADLREMSQQRRALTRYILAYERSFGSLNSCSEYHASPSLLKFRRVVIVVLVVRRLLALHNKSWCHNNNNNNNNNNNEIIVVTAGGYRSRIRIRLPSETCCLVNGGIIQLPFLKKGINRETTMKLNLQKEEEEGKEHHITYVKEEDLQLPVLIHNNSYNEGNEINIQINALRNLIDTLLNFVTVSSNKQEILYNNVNNSLCQRLANGLHTLLKPIPNNWQNMNKKNNLIPQKVIHHLPPRPPTSSTKFIREEYYEDNNSLPSREPSARALSYSPKQMQEKKIGEKNNNSYPIPQPISDKTCESWKYEEALHQSLLRDAQNINDSQESQLGNGFASEVLNVIKALDQRVVGALERHGRGVGEIPQRWQQRK